MAQRLRLGVNIDHVATLRNARGGALPDPVRAAVMAQAAGADGITGHLREDRRHIRDALILAHRLVPPVQRILLLARLATVPLLLVLALARGPACHELGGLPGARGVDPVDVAGALGPHVQVDEAAVGVISDPHLIEGASEVAEFGVADARDGDRLRRT